MEIIPMNASRISSRLVAASKTVGGGLLIIFAGLAGYYNGGPEFSPSADPHVRTGTFAGPAQPLGNGTAHAFVTLEAGSPVAIGVRVTASALETLPVDAGPHGVHETVLALPVEAPTLPYDHISFDWQPRGHEPDGVYDRPHFDVHFYMMTAAERDRIDPVDPAFEAQGRTQLDSALVPAGYVPTPDLFARMGVHWVDPSSPEFTPAGFSRTFIYGFWNGQMNFLEPMITTAFLESVKTLPGQAAAFAIPQPQRVPKAGYYPTRYSIRYDAAAQAYDIALEGLVKRSAAVR